MLSFDEKQRMVVLTARMRMLEDSGGDRKKIERLVINWIIGDWEEELDSLKREDNQ